MLAFVVAVLLLSIVPGQDMMFIVSNAAVGGRPAGVVAALGMSNALAVHTVAAALGLTALLTAAPAALDAVRWAGAGVLVYLAVTTWLQSRRPLQVAPSQTVAPRRSLRRTYAMAVLTDLANPKVILFYIAFVPQFIATGPSEWPVALQLLALGGLFILIGLAVDASVGLLAGFLSEELLRRRNGQTWLQRTSAAIYGGLAVLVVADNP